MYKRYLFTALKPLRQQPPHRGPGRRTSFSQFCHPYKFPVEKAQEYWVVIEVGVAQKTDSWRGTTNDRYIRSLQLTPSQKILAAGLFGHVKRVLTVT